MTSPIYTKVAPSYPGKEEGPLAVAVDRILSTNGPIVGTIVSVGDGVCLAPTEESVPLLTSTVYVTAPITNATNAWIASSQAGAYDAFNNTGTARRTAYRLEPGQTIPIMADDLLKVFAMAEEEDIITYSGG